MEEIKDYLKDVCNSSVNISLNGFVTGNLEIKKLKYSIEYDILKLEDEKSSNNISINLNQIVRTDIDNKQQYMVIYTDNDLNIYINKAKESI